MVENNAQVDISMVYHRSIGRDGQITSNPEMRILDTVSRQMLCIVNLDAEQLIGLLTSLHQTVDAWVCPDEYRGRIGRRLVYDQRVVPIEILPTGSSQTSDPERWAAAQQWAEAERTRVGPDTPVWDEARLQFNAGWKLVLHRWEQADPQDESAITRELGQ